MYHFVAFPAVYKDSYLPMIDWLDIYFKSDRNILIDAKMTKMKATFLRVLGLKTLAEAIWALP